MATIDDLTPYQHSALQQNEMWLNGISLHNYFNDECCPDFSCCYPKCFTSDFDKRLKRVNYLREQYGLDKIPPN